MFWRWLFNSVFVAVCVVVGRVGLSALSGYALARIRFPGYRVVFALVLAVMMVPPIILPSPVLGPAPTRRDDQHLPGLILPWRSAPSACS